MSRGSGWDFPFPPKPSHDSLTDIPDFPLRMGVFKREKSQVWLFGAVAAGEEAEREQSGEKFQSQLLNPDPPHHMSKTPFP